MFFLIAVFFYVPTYDVPEVTADYAIGTPTSGEYVEGCVASRFASKNDKLKGGASPYLKKIRPEDPYVRPTDVGVAHRTLPFGTIVEITLPRTGKTTTATVIDRGPFGRVDKNGKWYSGASFYRKHKSKEIPGAGWVGCLDMTPPVVDALDHNHKEYVTFEVIEWPNPNT
ncbi:hypothetical protein LCGC14_0932220 [marine sediment metagenome]|uniref:Uncharacterized protein n=1 Tax=marine sediment metagenome TaxID=412755 RepID=A0A0F9R627_9ZZZZ